MPGLVDVDIDVGLGEVPAVAIAGGTSLVTRDSTQDVNAADNDSAATAATPRCKVR